MDVEIIIFLILAIVVLFCFTVFGLLSYSGLFYEPTVSNGEVPWDKDAVIAYKFIKGPYNGNDIGATFTEVTSIAPKAPPVGIFYDDPHKKKPERLRSAIGCLMKENPGDKAEKSHVDEEQEKLLTERGFKVHRLPCIDLAIIADFPYTTPFSLWLAPARVYSRLTRYIEERSLCAYPFVEVYKNCKILYAAPLSKQEDFFVEECKIAESEEDDDNEKHQHEITTLGAAIEATTEESDASSFEEIGADDMSRKTSPQPSSEKTKND